MSDIDKNSINASAALGDSESLTENFKSNKGGGDVHQYKLNKPITVKLSNGKEVSVNDISVVNRNSNDSFFAPGESFKAKAIVARKDTDFAVGKKPFNTLTLKSEKMDMDSSTGVIRQNSKDADGYVALPKGSYMTETNGEKIDLSGATIKVPPGTDAVQMVELKDGTTAFIPLEFDKLDAVPGEKFTEKNKKDIITREYTETKYNDTNGDFKKQYEGLGLSEGQINRLVEEAGEVKVRVDSPTKKDAIQDGISDLADKAAKAVDGIKGADLPNIPKIPGG